MNLPHQRSANPCPEGGVSRRSFLQGLGLGAVALGGALAAPGVSTQFAWAQEAGYAGDVLVVVSLRGGFDGLAAVPPLGDAEYLQARPITGVPVSRAIQLDQRFGLHPALAPLKPYWDAGSFGVVHAVGHASNSRSHFQAEEELERSAPGSSIRTGWLDRALGAEVGPAMRAVVMGSSLAPAMLAGPTPEIAMRRIEKFELNGDDTVNARRLAALQAMYPDPAGAVASTASSLSVVGGVGAAAAAPENGAVYPEGELGPALQEVARLVKAGVGMQVACVDYGDWDMHENLGTVDAGRMLRQLTHLGQSLAAFATDLGSRMQRVSVVTLSEFGRRVDENGSAGTDHGRANAVLLLGGGVVGGRVHGVWPGLAEAARDQGDLAPTSDYRDILGEILVRRCEKPEISRTFPGHSLSPLGIVKPL